MSLAIDAARTNAAWPRYPDVAPPETTPKPTGSDSAEPSVRVTLSPEAMAMMSQTPDDGASRLPDVLIQATRRDQQVWINMRSMKPWTPETQRQFDQYSSGLLARANQAFNLVQDAISTEGLDLNNPDNKEVYEKATRSLFITAYKALENGNAFVDGPGNQDMRASDFISMLRNTEIVFKGGPYAVAGEFDPASGRLVIYPSEVISRTAAFPRDVAINSVMFHELGHAVGAGRQDFNTTWQSYRSQNSGLSESALYDAWGRSDELRELERRTSSRGWGLSEIAGVGFDPGIHEWGYAQR